MLRAFWTWDPVSSGTYKSFDEPYAYQNNKWFFDKSVWQKMFRAMDGCGMDAMILANTHPFPFMIDLSAYPDAKIIDDATLSEYQAMHHWIFETAFDYGIASYVMFYNVYYPDTLLKARNIKPEDTSIPTDFAVEYMNHCTRLLLDTYTEVNGIFVDGSENLTQKRAEFLQHGIIDALDAVRPEANIYISGCTDSPDNYVDKLKRRGSHVIKYSVKYTGDNLVDANPDPIFSEWVEAVGGANVLAEIRTSNFEPWTCFSYGTAQDILSNLEDSECDGFSLQPVSMLDWPRISDTYFKFQWQRDMVWYSVWGGSTFEKLMHKGQPKWLVRNYRLLPGFEAASRILELLSLYFAGDKSNAWHPQFCSINDPGTCAPHLFSIEDMLNMENQPAFSAKNWWEDVTGDQVVHLAGYLKSGTPEDAYGPDELIEELTDLSQQAITAGEKGMRNASGEKELPSFSRDAFCMGRLGEFYVERLKAALSHGRGDNTEAFEHMNRALGLYEEIQALDSAHRGAFRVAMDHCPIIGDWTDTVKALEAELEDASKGEFKLGKNCLVHEVLKI